LIVAPALGYGGRRGSAPCRLGATGFWADRGANLLSDLTLDSGMNVAPMEGYARTPPLMGDTAMLWTIFMILLVLWALGLVTSYTAGGFIHVLLVIAVIVVIIQLLQGRKVM